MYFNKNKIHPATVSEATPASDRLEYIIMQLCIFHTVFIHAFPPKEETMDG